MISQKKFYRLYNKNSPDNIHRNSGPIDARLFLRDLSLPLAYNLAKRRISPNAITIVFFIISLLANSLLLIPSVYPLIIMIVLHEIAQYLDCVDGQLARYSGTSSRFGKLLDSYVHTIVSSSFMLIFGVRLFMENSQFIFLILGGIGSSATAFDLQWHEVFDDNKKEIYTPKTQSFLNKLHKIYLLTDEIRIVAGFFLLFTLAQTMVPQFKFVELGFSAYVLFFIFDRIIYRFFIVFRKASLTIPHVWKGWSKE